MKSGRVYLSPLAEFKIDKLLAYLEEEWGDEVRQSFLEKLKQTVEQINTYPESFQKSELAEGVYKGLVTSHTALFYRFHEGNIEIITIIDNRQNPRKVANEIKKYFGL